MGPGFFISKAKFLLPAMALLCACTGGGGEKKETLRTDTVKTAQSVSNGPDKTYEYGPQLFKIDVLEFKLNKDDLPFPFNEKFLKEKRVKNIAMSMNLKEGKFDARTDYVWEINTAGQVTKEIKLNGKKAENTIERSYSNGLLSEMSMANPGDKFESSIKKVRYIYANNLLATVYDILESGDSIETDYLYKDGRLVEEQVRGKEGLRGKTRIAYYEGRPIQLEFYKGNGIKKEEKGAIYNYTYTRNGKLLYGDHWYPGISNDSYIFEFDGQDRLREITYKIFLNKEELKIPGKTKSYRFEYENDMLKRINYFMQASTFSQSGSFEFSYQYY